MAFHGGSLLIGCDSGVIVAVRLADLQSPQSWECTMRQPTRSPVLSLTADDDAVYAGTYRGTVLRLATATATVTESQNLGAPVPSLIRHAGRLLAGTYNGEVLALDPLDLSTPWPVRMHEGSVKSMAPIDDGLFVSGATRPLRGGRRPFDPARAMGTWESRQCGRGPLAANCRQRLARSHGESWADRPLGQTATA